MTVKLLNDNATCTKNKQIHKGANKGIGSKAFPVYSSLIPQLSSSIPRKIPHSVMPNAPLWEVKKRQQKQIPSFYTQGPCQSHIQACLHIFTQGQIWMDAGMG